MKAAYGFWIGGAALLLAAGVMLWIGSGESYLPFWIGVAGIVCLAVGGSVRRWAKDRRHGA